MVLIYLIGLFLTWLLIEATWGITVGSIAGVKLAHYQKELKDISKTLKEMGINEKNVSSSIFNDDWHKTLPNEIQDTVTNLAKRIMQDINWLNVTLFVSVFVFAIVGFLCGFINRGFASVGIIVMLSFLINNPVIRFPYAKDLGLLQKVIVVLAQFGVCYLFGYLGALLSRKYFTPSPPTPQTP